MSNITPFKFNSSTVRVITDDNGEPWFVAKETTLTEQAAPIPTGRKPGDLRPAGAAPKRRMRKKERNMHDDIPPDEAAEFSRAFNLCCMLDEAKATAARLRAASDRTTGLEREANVRLAAEAEAEMARIEAELRGEGHQSEAAAPERVPAKAQRIVSARVQGADSALCDAPDDWKVQARAIADEINDADAKAGAHDGLRGIADRVAKRLRERGINGPRGPLSGGTILREALQGGQWKRKERIR